MSKTTPNLHSQSFICVNPRHPSRVSSTLSSKILPFSRKPLQGRNFSCKVEAFHGLSIQEGSRKQRDGVDVAADDDAPVSVALEPISSETHFDRVLADAQQLDEALVIVWYFSDFVLQWIGRGIASWCRKCIYLKPKLEKLAADYYPRVRFYRVDVNSVPHKLVARAGVTKMPTIQLWKDGKKQAEVIGGHKGHLVVNEVREMIENEPTTL